MTAVLSATDHDIDYQDLLSRLRVIDEGPLFSTDDHNLFNVFLANIPAEHRQHYKCNTCRQFVNRYGGLVTIDEQGNTKSAIWTMDTPSFFNDAIAAVIAKVKSANVTGVFYDSKRIWGTPETGIWHHLSVVPPESMVYKNRVKTAGQAISEKHEDFRILNMSLAEYSRSAVEQAVLLLRSETLYRSEKFLGIAEWLLNLHIALEATKNKKTQANLIWRAVATAPAGFCHVRSSMIGTLLDDIVAKHDYEAISSRFAQKMNPLQYQRPQAAPTVGNIDQAEKLVEKLGIAESLKRRFARLEDLSPMWTPPNEESAPNTNGVFSHLRPQSQHNAPPPIVPTTQVMTWVKFRDAVLPQAQKIEFFPTTAMNQYAALVTASDLSAPPIIQWDLEGKRNPVSWYVYHGGSSPQDWLLEPMKYVPVTAICLQPSMLADRFSHQGDGVFFILQGAKDARYKHSGLGLFPEIMKTELREVRSVIEAYSRRGTLDGYEDASGCGLRLQKGIAWNCTLRVTTKLGMLMYQLDRWD